MNDFTKEELEEIYCYMENEPIELMTKVRFLIDNYCEHECNTRDAPKLFSSDGPIPMEWEYRCEQCGRVYYGN